MKVRTSLRNFSYSAPYVRSMRLPPVPDRSLTGSRLSRLRQSHQFVVADAVLEQLAPREAFDFIDDVVREALRFGAERACDVRRQQYVRQAIQMRIGRQHFGLGR